MKHNNTDNFIVRVAIMMMAMGGYQDVAFNCI